MTEIDSSATSKEEFQVESPTIYLSTIDFKTLGKTAFSDTLAAVSESGKSVGEFNVSVTETIRNEEICYHVHAHSHTEVDGVAMGTSITAYIARGVTTVEQTVLEYTKDAENPMDKKTVLLKEENEYHVRQIIKRGEEKRERKVSYPDTLMKAFVSEGADIILKRVMCLRQDVPENSVFIALDSNMELATMCYEKLPDSSVAVDKNKCPVFGVQRQMISANPTVCNTFFLQSGYMASRKILGSNVTMKMTKMPTEEAVERHVPLKKDLHWEEDMQLHSHYLDKKEAIIASHRSYLEDKPEISALLKDFTQFLLLRKPDDVCSFAAKYFADFSTKEIR